MLKRPWPLLIDMKKSANTCPECTRLQNNNTVHTPSEHTPPAQSAHAVRTPECTRLQKAWPLLIDMKKSANTCPACTHLQYAWLFSWSLLEAYI